MKKNEAVCAVAALCALLLPLTASADGWRYTVNGNECTITGYDGTETDLIIPAQIDGKAVTSIGNYAFYNCSGLTDITIPDSVTSIGEYAFSGCSSLTSITIPDGVRSIGNYVFRDCSSLTSITIPDSVTSINDYAFSGCVSLTSITIPESVTSIGASAFSGCTGMTDISILDGITFIGNGAFDNCDNLKYKYANLDSDGAKYLSMKGYTFRVRGIQYDYRYVFDNNNEPVGLTIGNVDKGITSLVIPDDVTCIDNHAFQDYSSLTSVTIPDSVTSIGEYAFCNCSGLTSITIPDSVTSIGQNAFGESIQWRCDNLKHIYMSANVTSFNGIFFPDDATIYCREFSEADYWATGQGYNVVYVDDSFFGIGRVILLPAGLRMARGTTQLVTPGIFPATDDAEIEWSSSAPDIVSVAEDGALTALSKGTAAITAAWGDVSASMEVEVYIRATGFTLPAEAWVAAKGTLKIMPVVEPEGGEIELTWTCDNTLNATVDANGVVSGKKPGAVVTITASGDGMTRECTLHVCNPVSTVSFANENESVSVGGVFQAEASVTTTDSQVYVNKLVTFSSSNEDVATVDAEGRVTGVSVGGAVITARASNGVSASFTITVAEDAPLVVQSGTCGANGNNLTWVLDDGGTLTITGEGRMYDYDDHTSPFRYETAIKYVVIDDGVTSIGNYAFYGCSNLIGITIPDSVTSIGNRAFWDCESLASITIPDSVTSIGENTFVNCYSLTSITIPGNVTSIGGSVFCDCSSLTSVTILDGVTSIGAAAFYGCDRLTDITIPDSVTSIGEEAFRRCRSLTGITIPEGVISIGESAFYGCRSLTSLTISGGEISIGSGAFWNCRGLKNITISDSVISIGGWAFAECSSLTGITISDSVTSIGAPVFDGCGSLTNITISGGETRIGASVFYGCNSSVSITISDSVTNIVEEAFSDCRCLTDITISGGETSICNVAFSGCTSLTGIAISGSVTIIGEGVFWGCTSLRSISISDGETSIGDVAFRDCTSLTDIAISGSMTSIGGSVFWGCASLTSITIPDSVTSIGRSAFAGCSSLVSVTIPDGMVSIGADAFSDCSSLTSITIPDSVTSIGDCAFAGCSGLNDIIANTCGAYIYEWAKDNGYQATALQHGDPVVDEAVAPTCTETGLTEGSHCSVCNDVLVAQEVVPATGHTQVTVEAIPPTETEEGRTAGSCCGVCGIWFVEPKVVNPLKWRFAVNGGQTDTCSLANYYGSDKNLMIPEAINGRRVTAIAQGAFPQDCAVERLFIPESVDYIGTQYFTNKPLIYCYDLSEADIWAFDNGYQTVSVSHPENGNFYVIELPESVRVEYGQPCAVEVDIYPLIDGVPVVWESDDPSVATVEDGVITAVAPGSAEISVTVGRVTRSVQVQTSGSAQSFDVAPDELYLHSKDTRPLSLTNILPAGADLSVTWASSDERIAKVSEQGVVTALRVGQATVTVVSDTGVSRACTVHVFSPVTGIAFSQETYKAIAGGFVQLSALVTAGDDSCVNQLVTFASSDETIMTVDENGLVTALQEGSVTITATAASGVSATCTVATYTPITLPAGLKQIEEEAFAGAAFEAVVIPSGCTSIGSRAFADCANLRYVRIPASVTFIADDAFEGCDQVVIDRTDE